MKKIVYLLILLLMISGCAIFGPRYIWRGAPNFEKISLGMNKGEVKKAIGPSDLVRGSMYAKDRTKIEVWEYMEAIGSGLKRQYWVYFADDKLVQWGEAGDWEKEADRIYEFRWR